VLTKHGLLAGWMRSSERVVWNCGRWQLHGLGMGLENRSRTLERILTALIGKSPPHFHRRHTMDSRSGLCLNCIRSVWNPRSRSGRAVRAIQRTRHSPPLTRFFGSIRQRCESSNRSESGTVEGFHLRERQKSCDLTSTVTAGTEGPAHPGSKASIGYSNPIDVWVVRALGSMLKRWCASLNECGLGRGHLQLHRLGLALEDGPMAMERILTADSEFFTTPRPSAYDGNRTGLYSNRTSRSGAHVMPREHQKISVLDRKAKKRPSRDPRPLAQLKAADRPSITSSPAAVRLVPIASIRTDGETQNRIAPDPNIVQEYAELMREGVEFPPVDVRWDGTDYWLSDGFQRIGAAKVADLAEIRAAIGPGTREDAQWDSYAANSTHGLRRNPVETERVIRLALRHPNAAKLSNIQMAKHLHIPESTVRYWRDRSSSQVAKMRVREVTRCGVTYNLNVENIGKNGSRRATPRHSLQRDLAIMKERSLQATRGLLAIIEKWVRGQCDSTKCLEAIEGFLKTRDPERLETPLASDSIAVGTSRR
jgi:hypothetical protein